MENTPEQKNEASAVDQKSEKKKWIIIAVVVVLGLFFLKTIFSPENIAERMIEQASNGEYDVDFDNDGSVQVTSGDGEEVNIMTGKSTTLPDGWPSSIPLLDDANIEYSAAVEDGSGGKSLTITYETAQDVTDVIDFYKKELVANGWTIEVSMVTGDGSMLSASKGEDDGVVVNIASSDGSTTVVISTQSEG